MTALVTGPVTGGVGGRDGLIPGRGSGRAVLNQQRAALGTVPSCPPRVGLSGRPTPPADDGLMELARRDAATPAAGLFMSAPTGLFAR